MVFVLELFFYTVLFFNEVAHLGLKFVFYLVLLAHLMESLQFLLLFFFVFPDFANQSPDVTDVVGQSDATESLNKNQDNGFVVVGGAKISEPNCQHDVGAPVVAPNILDEP